MEKNFELGLVLGRFNHMHLGHKRIIDISKSLCKKTLVFIGSSQESGTLRNPFKIETREKLLTQIYGDDSSIIISGLEDLSNEYNINFDWGKYVLDNVEAVAGCKPDFLITGNDESRRGWYDAKDVETVSEMIVSRKIIEISGTDLRGDLLIGNKERWSEFMPDELKNSFEELREELINISVYKEIYNKISDNLTVENFSIVYKRYEEEYRLKKLNLLKNETDQ